MMATQQNSSGVGASRRRLYATTALMAALGAALSAAVFCAAYYWEQRSIRHEFACLAEDRFHAIAEIVNNSARLLDFANNVFLVGPPAESPEFPNYLRSLMASFKMDESQHPAVRAVTWMPRVARDQRAAYERAARMTFDSTFKFGEPSASTTTDSSQEQKEFFPNYLCLSATPGLGPSGDDFASDPVIWKAMERARDHDSIVAIAPKKTSADSNTPLSYQLFQPLYHGTPSDVASRRQAIAGFLCTDLDISVFVTNALKNLPPVGIDVWVYDDADGKKAAVCEHTTRLHSTRTAEAWCRDLNALEPTWTTNFFGRKLLLRCSTTPAFWGRHTIWQPWALLCAGLALTLVVVGHQLSLALRANVIEQSVATRMAAFYQDIEQQRDAKRGAKQSSPPADSANDA
jgi:hypothetical protein